MPDLIVTPVPGDRHVNAGPGLFDALSDLAHRLACEAAQMHQLQYPRTVEFMEAETGRKGWRAFMSEETARAVSAIEADTDYRFVHVDDA